MKEFLKGFVPAALIAGLLATCLFVHQVAKADEPGEFFDARCIPKVWDAGIGWWICSGLRDGQVCPVHMPVCILKSTIEGGSHWCECG
ncbi:MAG: hypothetical protein KF851_06685 [Pirellulaceae bacterium]|nr:hypothetical protein [Pirellulaceae bacterium]